MTMRDGPMDDPLLGPAGLPFPDEREWLALPMPAIELRGDFVARTLRALADDGLAAAAPGDATADNLVTGEVLAAFASPEPAPDFVARTMAALQKDRGNDWRELLARYTAPEPSPQFVARTLAALAADRGQDVRTRRWWALPLLATAAAAALWFAFWSPRGGVGAPSELAPFELRLARRESPAFAHAYAATPLATVVATHGLDPHALPDGGADGTWLLFGGAR